MKLESYAGARMCAGHKSKQEEGEQVGKEEEEEEEGEEEDCRACTRLFAGGTLKDTPRVSHNCNDRQRCANIALWSGLPCMKLESYAGARMCAGHKSKKEEGEQVGKEEEEEEEEEGDEASDDSDDSGASEDISDDDADDAADAADAKPSRKRRKLGSSSFAAMETAKDLTIKSLIQTVENQASSLKKRRRESEQFEIAKEEDGGRLEELESELAEKEERLETAERMVVAGEEDMEKEREKWEGKLKSETKNRSEASESKDRWKRKYEAAAKAETEAKAEMQRLARSHKEALAAKGEGKEKWKRKCESAVKRQGELAKAVAVERDHSEACRITSSELVARLNSTLDAQTLRVQTAGAAATAARLNSAQLEKNNSELKAKMRADLGNAMAQVRKIQELKQALAISQSR